MEFGMNAPDTRETDRPVPAWNAPHDGSSISVVADPGNLRVARILTSDGHRTWELLPMRTFIANNDRARFQWSTADVETAPSSRNRILKHLQDPDHASTDIHEDILPKHVTLVRSGTTLPSPLERIGKRLGQSKNTKVSRNWYPETGYDRPLALKTIECSATPIVPMDKALIEVAIMQHLAHHHVVSYVASYEATNFDQYNNPEDQVLGIIMYPPGRCDLEMALDAISKEYHPACTVPLSANCLKHLRNMFGFFGCLSQALSYLHTTDVIIKHKDIKPANIIIDAFEQPLITDFGISKRYEDKEQVSTQGGSTWTKKYAPPEAYNRGETCGFRSDVFSLGCVFLELLTVLLGVPLERLKEHMNGQPYHRALDRVKSWLTDILPHSKDTNTTKTYALHHLLNESRELTIVGEQGEVKEVLHCSAREVLVGVSDTILKMLSRSAEDRPHASELFEMFEPLYQYTEDRQACDICKLQDQTRILPEVKEGYRPPMQTADYPPGINWLKETLPNFEDKDTDSPLENISPVSTRRIASDHADIDITNALQPMNGGPVARTPPPARLLRGRTSMPTLPAVRSPDTRPATSIMVTSRDKAKWKKGLLCYNIRPIRPNKYDHDVYIQHAELEIESYTAVSIHKDLKIRFEALDRRGYPTGVMSEVDLKQQGMSVLWRAASGWNKHVYVHGNVLAR